MLFSQVLAIIFVAITILMFAKTFSRGHIDSVTSHVKYARIAYGLLLVDIVFIELLSRLNGGPAYEGLLLIHLCFVVPILLIFTSMLFWINGLKYPVLHTALAWMVAVFLTLPALLTGITLLMLL